MVETIDKKVPTTSVKLDSVGIPEDVRQLIAQKRKQRRLWQKFRIQSYKNNVNRLQKQIQNRMKEIKKEEWRKYCNDMELEERQTASWKNIKSVLNTKRDALLVIRSFPQRIGTGKLLGHPQQNRSQKPVSILLYVRVRGQLIP